MRGERPDAGRDPGGFVITTLLGIAGAVVGGAISVYLGLGDVEGFDVRSMLIAVLGSATLLFGYRMLRSA
jgi:uncharacterized membrane protein YeaQ/YmgE (transglycosylase-associated protein family)